MRNTQIFILCFGWLVLTQANVLSAQKTATWIGGFPGQETNWACARNWSLNKVPDANCHAVIPMLLNGKKNYPVLSAPDQEVYSLVIETHAELTILPSGELNILGLSPYDKPFWNAGALFLSGKLLIPKEVPDSMAKR
ncbi:MAG: hypothetical protein H7246_17805 [Phycisphaerae bacterium]|nr:hypothetical protein [Saprospiraceae bacterium]